MRHTRAVMHVGIAYLRWRGKCSRHSRRMRTRKFTYLVRSPLVCTTNPHETVLMTVISLTGMTAFNVWESIYPFYFHWCRVRKEIVSSNMALHSNSLQTFDVAIRWQSDGMNNGLAPRVHECFDVTIRYKSATRPLYAYFVSDRKCQD